MYAQKYVHECLLEFDWSVASDIIAAEPSFQVHCHVIYIYIYIYILINVGWSVYV